MIEQRNHKRVAALRAELGTVHLDGTCVMDSILGEVREVLDTDTVLLYSVDERLHRWEVARWHQAGGDPRSRTLLEQALAKRTTSSIFYYDVLWPAAAHRNRVVDASQWIDRSRPGTWEDSRMYREVLQPVGKHRHAQPRALICDGKSVV